MGFLFPLADRRAVMGSAMEAETGRLY